MYTRVLVSRFGRPKSKVSEDLGKPSRPANRSNEDRRPAAVKACPGVYQKTGSKDGNLLKGPWAGPKPHAAASLRPPGSHLVRVAGWHLELLSGRPGRDEDPAASG